MYFIVCRYFYAAVKKWCGKYHISHSFYWFYSGAIFDEISQKSFHMLILYHSKHFVNL